MARYSRSRQKACTACSAAKTRCIRTRPNCCSRCEHRQLDCGWPEESGSMDRTSSPRSVEQSHQTSTNAQEGTFHPRDHEDEYSFSGLLSPPANNRLHLSTDTTSKADDNARVDFSRLDMVCPIDAADISNRWLKAYVPDPSHKAKQYSGPIVTFIYRILKSFAAVTGELPEFFA